MFVVTHRPQDQPPAASGFAFVDGLDTALALARDAAGDRAVSIMGGADVIRQTLAGGHVDTLGISIAAVVLGAGKRLFDGFEETVLLEQVDAVQTRWVTHLTYRVVG